MSIKEAVSASYLDTMRARYGTLQLRPAFERRALVIGSDGETGETNIGAGIARWLRSAADIETDEYDITTLDARDAMRVKVQVQDTTPDLLVLANGESHLDWIEDMPEERMHAVLSNTLTASIVASHVFVQETLAHPWRKQIIFIGSMAHSAILNGSAVYCAAKAGLAHYARCLAWELAPKGYDVFTIHPSNTAGTPMTEATIQGLMRYRKLRREDAEAYWGAGKIRDEWLTPDDIGTLVCFLASGSAGYLCGTDLNLGGGAR